MFSGIGALNVHIKHLEGFKRHTIHVIAFYSVKCTNFEPFPNNALRPRDSATREEIIFYCATRTGTCIFLRLGSFPDDTMVTGTTFLFFIFFYPPWSNRLISSDSDVDD